MFPYILFYFQFVTIYAAYLYDAVKLYTNALLDLIEKSNKTLAALDVIDTDGQKIIETIINKTSYQSEQRKQLNNFLATQATFV